MSIKTTGERANSSHRTYSEQNNHNHIINLDERNLETNEHGGSFMKFDYDYTRS